MLASSRSAGSKLDFMGKEYTVVEAKPEEFDGVDIVLASAGGSTSLALAKEAAKKEAVFILIIQVLFVWKMMCRW